MSHEQWSSLPFLIKAEVEREFDVTVKSKREVQMKTNRSQALYQVSSYN